MFGRPHPNEPMGAMMLKYFTRAIVEDDELRESLGYTWYIIKSIDVDGTQLNEKWFKGFAVRGETVEKDIHYEVTPIKKLVSIQLESGMIVADYLNPEK